MDYQIRLEKKEDYRKVEEMLRDAFWNVYEPGCMEHLFAHKLRKSREFIPELDFVAEKGGQILGNIMYAESKIVRPDQTELSTITLGPIGVVSGSKKTGIGGELIRHSLAVAKKMGFGAVILLGDPRYYSRFGFRCAEKYDICAEDGKYMTALQALELIEGVLSDQGGRYLDGFEYTEEEGELEAFEAEFPNRIKAVTDSQLDFKVLSNLRF